MHDTIPLWFLLFGLFFPRLTMIGAYFAHQMPAVFMPSFVEFCVGLFIPRILIAYIIYERSGTSNWFWIYIIFAVLFWIWGSTKVRSTE